MIRLDAATVLLQWATGGLAFLWVTTRRREVCLGYGWLLRGTYGLMALGALYIGCRYGEPVPVRDAASARRGPGDGSSRWWSRSGAGRRGSPGSGARASARSARVAAMTGIDRGSGRHDVEGAEFPPGLDLVAPVIGLVGLVAAGAAAGDPRWALGRPGGRRRRVPRGGHRRHAPRPLVPRAARHAAGTAAGAGALDAAIIWPFELHRDAVAGRDGSVITGDDRRRLQRACSGGCGSPARSPRSCWSA